MASFEMNADAIKEFISIKKHELFSEIRPHIVAKFWQFHKENPRVYELIKQFAYQAKNSGRQRFGIKMIWERLRWYTTVETTDEQFKLCNNHHSCYARLLMIEDPSFEKFFSRKTTIKQKELF